MFDKWKEKLAHGQIGLDALMNLSALYSFATDQKALDDRIRLLICITLPSSSMMTFILSVFRCNSNY